MKRLRPDNPNTDTTLAWKAFQAGGCVLPQTDWARLEALVKYYKGGTYLDVGCGASPMPWRLAAEHPDAKIFAIDHDEQLVAHLASMPGKPLNLHYLVYWVNAPLGVEECDYLVAGELIEHLDDPAAFIAECYRVLKPGGMLALSTPLSEGVRHGRVSDQHVWSFEGPDVEDLLQSAGFIDVRAELFKEDSFPIILGYGRKPAQ